MHNARRTVFPELPKNIKDIHLIIYIKIQMM